MIRIEGSCDEQKLRKVLINSRYTLSRFTGLTAEDKEDILMSVVYRFEVDKAKFPISVYVRYCHNKIVGFLGKKTAKKRMQQKQVGGKTVYIDTLSLDARTTEGEDMTLQDIVPSKDTSIQRTELLADVERKAPELTSIVEKVLDGERLTVKEKSLLRRIGRRIYSKEDLC